MAEATYSKLKLPNAFMPCARDENKLAATNLFANICPDGYFVDEVHPFPGKKKPYCKWLVKFTRIDDLELPLPLKKVYRDLTKYNAATNAKVFSRHHGGRFAAFIVYSVICDCNKPLDFELTALPYPSAKWSTVKTEVMTDLTIINGIETLDLGIQDIFKIEAD